MRIRFLWAGLIALMCGSALADGLYRWVDKSGKVHYGDAPAADAAKVEQKKFGAAPTVDVNDLPYATRRAKQNFPVTLYIAENCGDPANRHANSLISAAFIYPKITCVPKKSSMLSSSYPVSEGVPTLAVGKTWFKVFRLSSGAVDWIRQVILKRIPSTTTTC